MDHETLLKHLAELAACALEKYSISASAPPVLINLSENATYRVDGPAGARWALRVHREGYHSRQAIASELAWMHALRQTAAARVPRAIPGTDGELIQQVSAQGLPTPRNVVLFEWESGTEPDPSDIAGYERLGEVAARMHKHVQVWTPPRDFERHIWNFETSLGSKPHWGRWRDGIGVTPDIENVLAETIDTIEHRLRAFGQGPDVFGLVHGDMRLANLLVDGTTVKVIDFDDCGFSWFLYDCATTVSFFEESAAVPDLVQAWIRGYRTVGRLSETEEREIETFIMLRRILLVAWIGSHSETELAQSMGLDYTHQTVPLCERYLSRFGKPTGVSVSVAK